MNAPRRLLVVTTVPLEGALRDRVLEHAGGPGAEVKVVAPAAEVSPLQWLMSDEDEARDEAAHVAEQAAQAVGGEPEVGESDPVQAIEDALATFPADEVVVVMREGDDASWLEADAGEEARERLGVPVTQLAADGG